MNSFWNNLYDWSKDRRRAAFFFITLVTFLGLAVPGLIFYLSASPFNGYFVYALPGIGALIAALAWRAIRRLQAQRRSRSTFSPLSRDEWRKARSKLLKDQKTKKL